MTTGKTYDYQKRIFYHHTDRMGFVYYARYWDLFEEARTEMLRSWGITYDEVEQELGIAFPVAETHIRYLAPLHYDDNITIKNTVSELRRASFKIGYEIYKADGTLATEAFSLHPVTNIETGRPTRMPAKLRSVFLGE